MTTPATIHPACATIAPSINPAEYLLRYEGRDYIIRIVPMAAILFGDWER